MSRSIVALALAGSLSLPAAAPAFSFSSISGLLSEIGVHVDLPPRAEEAIEKAVSHVEGVLDNLDLPDFDLPSYDLPDFDLPHFSLPDVDEIVANAKAKAQEKIESALSNVHEKIDSIDLPHFDLSDLNLPPLDFDDWDLSDLNLPDLPNLDDAFEDILSHADGLLDDLEGTVHDALDKADSVFEGLFDKAHGILDDLHSDYDNPAVEEILFPAIDSLPPVAVQALEKVFGTTLYSAFSSTSLSVPEPTAAVAALSALTAALAARRRR